MLIIQVGVCQLVCVSWCVSIGVCQLVCVSWCVSIGVCQLVCVYWCVSIGVCRCVSIELCQLCYVCRMELTGAQKNAISSSWKTLAADTKTMTNNGAILFKL